MINFADVDQPKIDEVIPAARALRGAAIVGGGRPGRQTGVGLPGETLARIAPGETGYVEVIGLGWLAPVGHGDVEHHGVEIDFERDVVRDVQARVRRPRRATDETR